MLEPQYQPPRISKNHYYSQRQSHSHHFRRCRWSNLETAQARTARQRNSYCMGFVALKKRRYILTESGLAQPPTQFRAWTKLRIVVCAAIGLWGSYVRSTRKNRNSQRPTHHRPHHNSECLTFQHRSSVNSTVFFLKTGILLRLDIPNYLLSTSSTQTHTWRSQSLHR